MSFWGSCPPFAPAVIVAYRKHVYRFVAVTRQAGGFIGLVAPHIAQIYFGGDRRFYLPGSACFADRRAGVIAWPLLRRKIVFRASWCRWGLSPRWSGFRSLSIVLRHRGVSLMRVNAPLISAGLPLSGCADLNVPYCRAGKLPFCWGRTAVVNRRYYVRWPG